MGQVQEGELKDCSTNAQKTWGGFYDEKCGLKQKSKGLFRRRTPFFVLGVLPKGGEKTLKAAKSRNWEKGFEQGVYPGGWKCTGRQREKGRGGQSLRKGK